VALTALSDHPDAPAFLRFLRSSVARDLFERQGFTFLDRSASGS
jgi:molybdate transport system substrate-binding protein